MAECTKIPYESREEAIKVKIVIDRKSTNNHKMRVYKCEWCGKWHIGRQRMHGKNKFK